MSTPEGEMTLAFELSALRALAEPGTAFADARQWTESTGVVTEGSDATRDRYTRKRRIRTDFASMDEGITETLERVRSEFDTARYVLVSDGEVEQAAVEAIGWEYLPVEAAAAAAGWTVGPQRKPDGEPDRTDWP